MIELYQPDVPGAAEVRQYARFMGSEMNRLHGISDDAFTKVVDNVEAVLANKLPDVSLSVAAWAMFVFGDIMGSDGGTRGLFWQTIADNLLTREETRAAIGEELMPRPERVEHNIDGGTCSCGDNHEMLTAEEMIANGRQEIQRYEQQHGSNPGMGELVGRLEDLLNRLGVDPNNLPPMPNMPIPGLNPNGPPQGDSAGAAFALPVECVTEFGMDNVMRFVLAKVSRGDFSGVISAQEVRNWLKDNPK